MKSNFCFSFFLLFLLLSSCTMEKRLYRPGLHVNYSFAKEKQHKSNLDEDELRTNLIASNDLSVSPIGLPKNKFHLINLIDSCDNIILKNGDEISAKVTEVGVSEIKYKKCDNLNGPVYILNKKNVFIIKYSNGTKEIINEVEEEAEVDDEILNDEDYSILNDDFKKPYIKPEKQIAEGFGIAGFFILLATIPLWLWVSIFAGIAGSILAIVFGIISIARGFSNKDKFISRGFGVLSLILGLVLLIITMLILTAIIALVI